ncbi:MAG TPA: VOC family protein [Thermoleophilaceae bacterium]|nr:VOC family protein [Thermoleophilaceae bacterium]
MFDHVTIRVSDRDASERFYETVLDAIGVRKTASAADYAEWDDFSLAQGEEPTRNLHIAFCAWSHQAVDAFWNAGIAAGYRSDGEPGMRTQYSPDYYGAFLLDPDGNSAEAVYQGDMVRRGNIDHLWIRVPDVDAAQRFYELIAPHSGFELRRRLPERAHFKGSGSTFALVSDSRPQTQNLHLAFGADSDDTVDAFHAAAVAAGHRDNGPPGERPQYHAGYYAAFVLDPAGANVEVVSHNR